MAIFVKGDHHATYEVLLSDQNIGNVGAATTLDHTFTVAGVDPAIDTCVGVEPQQALEAGIVLGQCRVSAVNTVVARVANVTAGAVDPAATHDFKIILARR